MARTIEFIVKGIVQGESGRFRIIGRVSEDSISLGQVFSQAYQCEDRQLSDGRLEIRRVNTKNLALRVAGIHAYGGDLAELGSGMTGSLDLVGTGTELVMPGWLLGLPLSPRDESAEASSSRAATQT